jgi:hypothetical protein
MPEPQFFREKTGAIRSKSRLLPTLPGGVVPGTDKHLLFRQLYAALMAKELEERESAALVVSEGAHGYDKPLSGGQRRRCRRTARRLADAYVKAPPTPKRRRHRLYAQPRVAK